MYVSVVGAALALLAAWGAALRELAWSWPGVAVALGVAAACALLQIQSFTTVWRGHRLALHPDEAVLLLAFVALPPPLVILASLVGSVAGQALLRKPLVKGVFNVSVQFVATSAGAAAFMAAHGAGLAVVGAALLVPPAVSLVNQSAVAVLLTTLAGRRLRDAWTGGLFATVSVASVAGVVVGVVALALYEFHPWALVLALPVWVLMHRSMAFAVHTENELATRRALNDLSTRLLDASVDADIVALALRACDDAFAPLARGARVHGRAYGDASWPGAPRAIRLAAPMGAAGEVWIALPARSRSERERLEGLLALLANHVALALARAEAAREAELQRQALARAERLDALSTLVAGVAHEVNNPLTYVMGSLDLLEMDVGDVEAALAGRSPAEEVDVAGARERIERARTGARRVQRITRALGAVARSQHAAGRRVVRALDVLKEVEALVAPTLPPNVRASFEGDPRAAFAGVASDARQALLELVQNAVDATRERGGAVRVACAAAGDEVVVRVVDDGEGMPEEVRRRAFTPFFTTRPDGTGLGLAGVLGIVSAHGGTVRLESEAGKGTAVEMRFPAAALTRGGASAPAAAP